LETPGQLRSKKVGPLETFNGKPSLRIWSVVTDIFLKGSLFFSINRFSDRFLVMHVDREYAIRETSEEVDRLMIAVEKLNAG